MIKKYFFISILIILIYKMGIYIVYRWCWFIWVIFVNFFVLMRKYIYLCIESGNYVIKYVVDIEFFFCSKFILNFDFYIVE